MRNAAKTERKAADPCLQARTEALLHWSTDFKTLSNILLDIYFNLDDYQLLIQLNTHLILWLENRERSFPFSHFVFSS